MSDRMKDAVLNAYNRVHEITSPKWERIRQLGEATAIDPKAGTAQLATAGDREAIADAVRFRVPATISHGAP